MKRIVLCLVLALGVALAAYSEPCAIEFQSRRLLLSEEELDFYDYDEPDNLEGLRALERLIDIPRFNTTCVRHLVSRIACQHRLLPYFGKVLCSLSLP